MYGATAVAVEEGGRWTLEKVVEVSKAGGNLETLVDEQARRNIFRKELETRITDGEGTERLGEGREGRQEALLRGWFV
jgi:hypothetical protein